MNIQTKSSILVLSIFIFGILCGFFLHGVILGPRFHKPPFDRGRPEFGKRLEDVLRLKPDQTTKIVPILQKYDKELFITLNNARMRGKTVMDSMKTELMPLLSDMQKDILNRELNRLNNPPMPPDNPMR